MGEAEQEEIVPCLGRVGTLRVTGGRGPLHRAGAGEDRTTSQMHRRLQVKAVPVWAEVVTHDLIRESHSVVFTAWSIPKSLVPSGR